MWIHVDTCGYKRRGASSPIFRRQSIAEPVVSAPFASVACKRPLAPHEAPAQSATAVPGSEVPRGTEGFAHPLLTTGTVPGSQ